MNNLKWLKAFSYTFKTICILCIIIVLTQTNPNAYITSVFVLIAFVTLTVWLVIDNQIKLKLDKEFFKVFSKKG